MRVWLAAALVLASISGAAVGGAALAGSRGDFAQPDGRIRLERGDSVGNDIYNTTTTGQQRTGTGALGSTISLTVSIQNDDPTADRFRVQGAGSTADYDVRYLDYGTDLTAQIVSGTYTTPNLGPGDLKAITVRVRIKPTASEGSKVTRRVTLTSVGDGVTQNAVRFAVKRS